MLTPCLALIEASSDVHAVHPWVMKPGGVYLAGRSLLSMHYAAPPPSRVVERPIRGSIARTCYTLKACPMTSEPRVIAVIVQKS